MGLSKRIISITIAAACTVASLFACPISELRTVAADDNEKTEVVVVLDAGHGGSDSGAVEKDEENETVEDGLKEKDLNLKIATYCRDYLSEYAGVEVVMTREDDTFVTLEGRTDIAKKAGADAFVSFHINAAENKDTDGDGEYDSVPCGADVFYPNSNQDAAIGEKGKNLASFISQKLDAKFNSGGEKILNIRGIHTRDSSSKGSDGKPLDYYAVIRTSKAKGFPGIIIEHGFITSPDDVENLFSSDSKLKKLAKADAAGIVKYFGLKKKVDVPGTTKLVSAEETSDSHNVTITWNETDKATKYMVMRRTGDSEFKEIATVTDTSYTDTKADGGTTYYYTVIAGNDGGWSESYDTTGLKVTTSKDDFDYTKTTLKVKKLSDSGLRKIKIKWTKLSDAEGYRVYRKAAGETKWTTLKTIKKNSSSYVDKTVGAGKTYSYRLKAYKTVNGKKVWTREDASGKTITADSDKFSITGVRDLMMGQSTLTFDGLSDSSVTYQIRRKAEDGSYETLGTTKETTFEDKSEVAPKTTYIYKVRGYRTQSGKKIYSPYTAEFTFTAGSYATPLADSSKQAVIAKNNGLTLSWGKVDGAAGYMLYRKNAEGTWKKITSVSATTYTDTGLEDATDYTYRVRAYIKTSDGNKYGSYSSAFTGTTGYGILGDSKTTVAQMVNYYNSKGKTYPEVYQSGLYGPATIEEFCRMVYDISVENGVRAEVVFAQICKETGFLNTKEVKKTGHPTFGKDVDQEMCNFCGFGTTGGGVKGVDFGDIDWSTKYKDKEVQNAKSIDYENRTINPNGIRDGITAQVKHLKLYAAAYAALIPNDGTDPRYLTSVIGTAPYVEWLGIPDNPYGKGWASTAGYGYSLKSGYIDILLQSAK